MDPNAVYRDLDLLKIIAVSITRVDYKPVNQMR
jgi:hypothetical protein